MQGAGPVIGKLFSLDQFSSGPLWTLRGPSFAHLKDKKGHKERGPGPEGYPHRSYMFFALSDHLSKYSL